MPVITNIAAYKFATLTDLKSLREELLASCKAWELKGTILLSTEGINLFIAGDAASIEKLMDRLHQIPGLEDLTPKYSESDHQPFHRMLVRLKKEIIAFGVEGIDPAKRTSPKLPAKELKNWLDEGRPVILLDTRNDYEYKLGTFKNAMLLDIKNFRQFPEAVRAMPPEMKDAPIVMFCTGGIRCEKAGPFMENEGFNKIHQLEGGILKYFEECGGEHYEGECFVFDQRVGVDPSLEETDSVICFACQTPLNADEAKDPRYVPAQSCPYCFQSDQQKLDADLERYRQRLQELATPLPGSIPYDNYRPLNIPQECDGQTILQALCQIFPHIGAEVWLKHLELGDFLDAEETPLRSDSIVHPGDRILRVQRGMVEPDVNANVELIYVDEALVIVNKPAPLPMHPSGRFNRNTLQHLLNGAFEPRRVRAAHRLDANTTGLVACTLTRHFANKVQKQFTAGEVTKHYLARVQGHPELDQFECSAPISDEPGQAGSRTVEAGGQAALTHFKVLQRFDDGTSLLEVEPKTGRTNQIRVHLWHLGFPIVGDPVYLQDQQKGNTQTLNINAAPLCLHSIKLAFKHPVTGERVQFETPAPAWAKA